MKKTDFALSVQKFFDVYLAHQQGRRENTVKSYRDTFKLFLQFMLEKKSVRSDKMILKYFTSDAVAEYKKFLAQKRKNTGRTINLRLSALHSFAKFLQYEYPDKILQWQKIQMIPICRCEKKPVAFLSEDDLVSLIVSIKTESKYGLRDRTLLFMLYDTGARVQEIVDLTLDDVRIEKPSQVVLHGKGNKTRIVPLQNEAVKWLKMYMENFKLTREPDKTKPLFCNRNGKKITRFGVAYLLSKYGLNMKSIKGRPTPHQLRHSKAMHMLRSGIPTEVIQQFLGHSDIKTTAIYAQADIEIVRSALEKLEAKQHPDKRDTNKVPSWTQDAGLLDWLNNL